MPQEAVQEVLDLLAKEGNKPYPGETITILEHSLRTAFMAEEAKAPSMEITAALLHNTGFLLRGEGQERGQQRGQERAPDDATCAYLRRWFAEPILEPIRLQVAAKRYLCASEPEYVKSLSKSSSERFEQQGGPMSEAEAEAFLKNPHAEAAVRLRRLHDKAKLTGSAAPDLDHFVPHLDASTTTIDQVTASQIV